MDERSDLSNVEEKKRDSAFPSLSERQQKALDRFDAQRRSREEFEAEVHTQLSLIEQRLKSTVEDAGPSRAELQELTHCLLANTAEMVRHQAQASAEHAEHLAREAELQLAREQLARQQWERVEEIRRERESLDARAEEMHAEAMRIHHAQRALAAAEEEHREAAEQLARRRTRLDEQESRLEKELQDLERRRDETRDQRQRIARQLRRERAELEEEVAMFEEARRNWNRNRPQQELEHRPADDHSPSEETRQLLAAAEEELKRLAADLARAEQQTAEFAAKVAQLQQENSELHEQLNNHPDSESNKEDLANLRMERLSLAARVRELEQQLTNTESQLAEKSRKAHQANDMQRRFEMAVEEMRELKRRNAELEDEFARRGGRPRATIAKPVDSWEATKKRLLAELQGDATGPAPLSEEDRLTVEGAIRITDDAISQRDREIAQLKEQLAQSISSSKTASTSSTSPGQTATLEQEHLRELEHEWSEKIRKAEVELSIERAKIARERVQLEEKLRMLENELLTGSGRSSGSATDQGKKGGRRWLERLGLSGSDEE